MSKNDIAIQLTNISKKYLVSHQKPTLANNILGRRKEEEFWALKNINLTIKKGEKVGIIGPNGAGKTTLLKIITGITQPSSGIVKTNGKVVALINLEAGFHPDLTGEENIFVNGMLIGMSKAEIQSKKSKIIRFADIGKFIYSPFHTYSSGMKFRLAFAVAVASECETLIMDEVFVVGDVEFQKKTYELIMRLKEEKQLTLIFCSHIHTYVRGLGKIYYKLANGKLFDISRKQFESQLIKVEKNWRKLLRINTLLSRVK